MISTRACGDRRRNAVNRSARAAPPQPPCARSVSKTRSRESARSISASIGAFGGIRAQYHLRQSFVFLDMHPVNQPEVAIAHAAKAFNAQGELTDETTRQLIAQLLQALAAQARTRRAREPALA